MIADLPQFEQSANEIMNSLDAFLITDSSVKAIKNTTLYLSDFKQGNNTIDNKAISFPKTKKLVADKLMKGIFVQQDTTICFNTFNSKPTLAKFYRHFLCFSSGDKQVQLDISHAYKAVLTKRVKEGWTYLIVEQGFD